MLFLFLDSVPIKPPIPGWNRTDRFQSIKPWNRPIGIGWAQKSKRIDRVRQKNRGIDGFGTLHRTMCPVGDKEDYLTCEILSHNSQGLGTFYSGFFSFVLALFFLIEMPTRKWGLLFNVFERICIRVKRRWRQWSYINSSRRFVLRRWSRAQIFHFGFNHVIYCGRAG